MPEVRGEGRGPQGRPPEEGLPVASLRARTTGLAMDELQGAGLFEDILRAPGQPPQEQGHLYPWPEPALGPAGGW